MMCLSNSSTFNTSHRSFAHPHPMADNNKSTIFQVDDDMHDNKDSPTATMLIMTAIVCVIPVTAMSHPPFSKIVVVHMMIQRYSSMD
jgi:hypothetical protein